MPVAGYRKYLFVVNKIREPSFGETDDMVWGGVDKSLEF